MHSMELDKEIKMGAKISVQREVLTCHGMCIFSVMAFCKMDLETRRERDQEDKIHVHHAHCGWRVALAGTTFLSFVRIGQFLLWRNKSLSTLARPSTE